MGISEARGVGPLGIFKEAIFFWSKNLIPVVAVYCVNIFLARILQLSARFCGGSTNELNLFLSIFLGVEVVVVIALNSFLSLIVIRLLRSGQGERASFTNAFSDAKERIIPYLKALFLLLAFFLSVMIVAFFILTMGNIFYGGGGASTSKLILLVAACTMFVIFFIGACWYGFFFSLAPLVAAFEKKGPWFSMRESRSRVRGNALRYALNVGCFIVAYVAVGLVLYFVLTRFTTQKYVLNMIDPALAAIFGPLWLSIWLVCYQRFTEMKLAHR